MTDEELQAEHDQAAEANPGSHESSCYCCCEDCPIEDEA